MFFGNKIYFSSLFAVLILPFAHGVTNRNISLDVFDTNFCGSIAKNQADYTGTLSITKSGYQCQNWLMQDPHVHTRTPDKYPDSGLGDHNSCRNPDGGPSVWCFTTDKEVRWESCVVPYCEQSWNWKNVFMARKKNQKESNDAKASKDPQSTKRRPTQSPILARASTQFEPITDDNKYAARDLWFSNKQAAEDKYGPISKWDVSRVTNLRDFFRYKESFNEDISEWNVSSVTTMRCMFCSAHAYNKDMSGWDVTSVTNMAWMFGDAHAFNQDISGWDVGSVTAMRSMFWKARAFNRDLSGWDVTSVTNMAWMFYKAHAFNQDLSGWDVGRITNMSGMFGNATAFNIDLSRWDMSSVTDIDMMFYLATAFNQDLSGWDVGSVTNMGWMFFGARAFNQDLSRWDVSSVRLMSYMFYEATAFNQKLCWDIPSNCLTTKMFYGSQGSIGC